MVKKAELNALKDELQALKDAQASGDNSTAAFTALREALAFEGSDEELTSAITEQLTTGAEAVTALASANEEIATLKNSIEVHKATIAERDQTIAELKDVPGEASASAADGDEDAEPTGKKADAVHMPNDAVGKAANAGSLAEAIKFMSNND